MRFGTPAVRPSRGSATRAQWKPPAIWTHSFTKFWPRNFPPGALPMAKTRPDFADDLTGIQQDVATDIGKILEIANSAQREPEKEAAPTGSNVPETPARP